MELECDLSVIQNEDLLRRMWQQTADIDYKKEIRSHLYKLRESRLRDLYQGEIMAGNYAKDPLLNPSHGDSLVGQNFQSLKSQEVRDSMAPINDLKFQSMTLNHPNTTGWDVQTSSEVSPDGRAYRTETLATTDGVEKINGGTAEFRGRNEQRASASHQGDDKNFVKKASESSNTHLQEHVVVGDENSGRSEMKMSSTTTSSSSQVTSSSSTVEYGGGEPLEGRYLTDNTNQHHQRLTQEQYNQQQQQLQRQQQLQQQEFEQTKQYQNQQHQQRIQQQQTEFNRNRHESSTNVETQKTTEQSRRVVDMDKASPEYQQHVQHLMQQPGEIISNTVEYPKPNVKMITTVKRLPDGTIVKNKRYETEELRPTVESQHQRTTSTTSQSSTQQRNEQQRREQTEENVYNRQQNLRNNVHTSNAPRRPEHDVVDNAEPYTRAPGQQQVVQSRPNEQFTDESTNTETKFSSVQKSSRRFSTERTSETIEEFSDQPSSAHVPGIKGKPSPSKDFSTHGFPSVRPNKPTQEYPSDRPRHTDVEYITQRTVVDSNQASPANAPHGFPAVRPNTNVTTTKDGDITIVSSESTRSSKYKTNAERVIETEVVIDGDSSGRPQKFTQPENFPNHGFPAVRDIHGTPVRDYPNNASKPTQDFSTNGFPSARDVARPNSSQPVITTTVDKDGNIVTVVSSETKKTIKHNTNREHIIETEVVGDNGHHTPTGLRQPDKITFPPTPQPGDFSTHGFPSVRDSAPTNDYQRQGTPTRDYPSSPRKPQATEDFSTHGFPSVRTPNKSGPDYSTPSGGYPSTKDTSAPKLTPTAPRVPQSSSAATRKSTTTTDSSQRLISKERDVDATHRAFAASLRSSSPADSTDHHHRTTPRSSVSSTRTFRRDGREGSHDSETSRISSGTVTRSSPSKSVGKTVVTKQTVVKTRNVNGSNETIDLTSQQRPTKSPSPTKTITTTTTRTTTTAATPRRSPAGDVPKSDNQTKSKPAENTFPTIINEPLTITKTHFTANDASFLGNEVVEEPCLKKHFYKLGPSDKATTNHADERSPYSPTAPSNHSNRTHPKTNSPVRDDFDDVNHEEPIHKQPLSSSVIEPKQRNRLPSGPSPTNSRPQTICQPNKKEPSVERRTVVRESEFENTDWQNTILNTNENPSPVKSDLPARHENEPGSRPQDEYIDECTFIRQTPIDTSDYPVIRDDIKKRPSSTNKTETITIESKRNEKLRTNQQTEVIDKFATRKPQSKEPTEPADKKPTSRKPSDIVGKQSHTEPVNRRPTDGGPTGRTPVVRKPVDSSPSPTRKIPDTTTSKVTTTITKTARKDSTCPTDDNKQPKDTSPKKPTDRKPSDAGKNLKPIDSERSPTRKPIDTYTTGRKNKVQEQPVGRKPTHEYPTEPRYKGPTNKSPERSPTRRTTESARVQTITKETTNRDDTYSIEDYEQPEEQEVDDETYTTRTTITTETRRGNVSPTRPNKQPKDINKKPLEEKPTKPREKQSPFSKNEMPTTNVEEPAPTCRTPESKIKSEKTTKSMDIKGKRTQLTTTTVDNITDEKSQLGPKNKQPTASKPSKPEYTDEDQDDEQCTLETTEKITIETKRTKKPHPNVDYDVYVYENGKQPEHERAPNEPLRSKPTTTESDENPQQSFKSIDTQVEEEFSDTENVRTSFITTKIKKVDADAPLPIQPTHRTTYDENKRVKELFNKVDDTKITRNVNEEFITFEREVRDRNAPTEKPVTPTRSEYSEPTTKQPTKPLGDGNKETPQDREPRRPFDREPKSQPADKQPKAAYPGDDETTFKDSNTLKTTSVTTTIERVEQDRPYAPEQPRDTKQPKDKKPKGKKPKELDLSDNEEVTEESFETTSTITTKKKTRKDDLVTTIDVEEREFGVPEKKKPDDEKPDDRGPDKTLETITITGTTSSKKPYPKDIQQPREPLDKHTEKNITSDETKRVEELFKTTTKSKNTKDHNEEFIAIERQTNETPDGAFFSKAPEPEPEPSSPSFRKKGVSPRETFEDRCRQILGMENYGDTPGTFKKRPEDAPEQKEPITVNVMDYEVKIEDCEDDEPNYLNNIKESIKPHKKEPSTTFDKPQKYTNPDISDEDLVEEVECVRSETVVPFKRSSPEPTEPHNKLNRKTTKVSKKDIHEDDNEHIVSKTTSKVVRKSSKPKQTPKKERLGDDEQEETSSSESEIPEKETDEESQPDTVVSKRDMRYTEEIEIEENTNLVEFNEKQQPQKPSQKPGKSPTRKPSEPEVIRKTSPMRQKPSGPSTITVTKTIETKTKTRDVNKPSKVVNETKPTTKLPDSPDKHCAVKKEKTTSPTRPGKEHAPRKDRTPTKKQQKPKDSPTSTIKDRLRSATRNRKQSEPSESETSPDGSPTRHTERRRSSNISVHTEIIIDHTAPKSPKPAEKTPEKHRPHLEKPTQIDATSPTRPFRRFPVTERKESAPVPSVTRKDKEVKMTRSTSEKLMKVTAKPMRKTDVHTLAPSPTPKGDKRPNKCFTTKTINLTTSDKLINSEEMENIIIDIQHAKSSREPSPDKIVPTPVPVHLDTGKPRYPDVVQEPEDEPRKKPVITNIPIFEEESNEYVQCHISEVKTKLIDLKEGDILDNPTIEAPKSLDYPSIDKPDDDCLLSVHEKVSKFTHTAEEIKKPKASSPFSREFDKAPLVPENDECLLTVDEKVNKFIKTAEDVSKPITPLREVERPSFTDLDEELQRDDCTLSVSQKVNKFLSTAEKLAPSAPQRSPELVAKIERTISKQSEPEYPEGLSDDELTPFSQNHTIELEKRRQKDILSRPSVFENTTEMAKRNGYTKEEVTTVKSTTIVPEYEEVIPHTRDHTTKIELKRQKDILSRPSVYDKSSKPRPQSPNKREPTSPKKTQQTSLTNTRQAEYTAKRTTTEDNEKVEARSERKPSTTTTKPENRRSPTKPSTVAVTRSRFESIDNKKAPLKTSTEPKTNRLPSTLTNGRKPVNEPKPTGRKPSSDSITSSFYPSRRPIAPADHQSPQGRPRKPITEPDSHYSARKPSTDSDTNTRDYETFESETEFTTTTRRRSSSKTKDYLETVQTEIERFSPTQKEPTPRKTLTQEKSQKHQTFSHSPTRKDSTNSTTKVTHVTERTIQHNSPSECSDIEIVETIVERPAQVKTPIGRTRIVPDTVAARRNIFENNNTPKGQRPSESNSPSPVGRRPSYMEHTVSSLEHIRRDSLEVNKHNYSRKSSIESETNYERRPNSAVKFDVPNKPQRTASIPEDIDVESIFDLEVLEHLLETVTSYELRRRIRAQIRLVKKNTINTNTVDKRNTETKTSKSISSTHKTSTYTSNVHHEATDTINEDIKTRTPYESKASPRRPSEGPKVGRVTENVPTKTPSSHAKMPLTQDKIRREEEMTTKTSTYVKTHNGRSKSPQSARKVSPVRHHSPETKTSQQEIVKELRRTSGSSMSTHKEYVRNEQVDYSEEKLNSSRRVEQRTDRFEKEQSPDRSYSPESKSPTRDDRQRPDTKTKTMPNTRTKSPEARKPSYQRTTSPPGRTPKQRDELYNISKVTTVKTTTRSPERKPSKPNTDESTPIWADRKSLLKSPSSAPRKVPGSPTTRTTTTKSTTSKSASQRQTQNRNFEEDSITSSYGIGPTDENGLPLFGIKALKKKKPSQPCEATEEVTGYVIEEKYYSDSKTKPKVERKEYIYSTNTDELEEMKKTIEQSRKSIDDDVEVVRKVEKLDKVNPDTEDISTISSKYVRRGSVKELSEKFIRKESTQSLTEKSGSYPKAGLILRTSRGSSTEPNGDGYEITTEKYTTTSSGGHGYRSLDGDSDDEHNVLLRQKQTRHTFTDYDNKEDEQCHLSSTRSSTTKSTRSFLNSSGETKVVTSVDDALERMRNADYVVEAGDTAEDREARSLLNKFLGASVIMKGVESVLPTTKQTTTTTITKTSYADGDDDDDCDLLKNKALKTTRITKTTKSGSSSTPVTRTTCDIEEIWDEEILKELLEQATTYEERRKIRARLRDLMAEREEQKDSKSGELSDNAPEVDDSSVSEYEEIIEEVTATDYSDAEGDFPEEEVTEVEKSNQGNNASENKELSKNIKEQEKVEKEETKNKKEDQLVEEVVKKVAEVKVEANLKTAEESKVSRPNSTEACADSTDSKSVNDDKGESLVPLLQGILQKSLPTNAAKATKTEIESTKQAAEKSTRTRTNKQGCSHSCSCSSELSSDLCTVNNCNNNSNNNNSKNSKNSTDDNTNKLTNSEKQTTTITNDTNSNQSLDTNTTQPRMTRDIVMPKSAAQSGKVAGSSSNSSGNSTSRSSDITTKQRQLDRLCVPQKEDSGTESGEDLRLIAAGLRDSLQLQSDTNLIEEVTAALSRLEISLKEGKDIPVDGSKREALLALVARLQTGLSSPDAVVNLANITSNGGPFDETSSPEADGHRSNRQRFARRRNRNSRHTVGVSREELADARRYMEDMQLIENISNCTTPEGGMSANPITPPQWFPVEKNPSLGAILTSTSSSTLYRPNQFVDSQLKTATTCLNGGDAQIIHREKDGQKSKRPTSGNFSVSFQPNVVVNDTHFNTDISRAEPADYHQNGNVSPDSSYKSNRFTNKKQLLKRANTIDIPKSKKYNPDFDTDSEQEDKAPQLGLKRALQVNVKHKVRNVIPPFVPKTENDHKFLAFINKQSAKPGLGWTGSRSVSNWTNKFGNIKHTFEVGAAAQVTTGKPPQAPGHVPHNAAKNYWQKQVATQDYQQQQQYLQYQQQQQQQQQALQQQHAQQQLQRSQQEANERQRRAAERERLERERIELDRLERQRLERERQERDRLEREFYEREIVERERLAAAQHAAMPSMTVPKPAPVNKFQHAPQSVFRPIDNNETHNHNIFKPIPQLPQKVNTWQPPSILNKPLSAPVQLTSASPQFLTTKQSVNGAQVTSPSSTASSPIGLPWVAKPAVDNSDFRKKAHTFEERSQNDNHPNSYLQRHHSLRSPKSSQPQMNEYRKRPSLPSVANPYMASQSQYVPQQQLPVKPQSQQIYASSTDVYAMAPPPPTNISFTYADLSRNNNYKSYPCLPSAVETSITADYMRQRESSLTDPNATPLVLTTSNPTYEPPTENRAYYNHAPPLRQFDYASPMDSAPASPSCLTMLQADYTDDDLDSDNLMEYRAETRVMSKPQSQTAVTIRDRRTAHASDDEVFGKNSRNAQTLLHTMRNIGKNGNGVATVKKEPVRKVESPKVCLSPDGRAYQAPIVEPLFPEITKFEPNRTPEYIAENKIKTQTQSKQKKPRPKTPPMPNQQMDRSLQLALAEEKYSAEQQKYLENKKYSNVSKAQPKQQQQPQQPPQSQYQSASASHTSSTNSLPYLSETQAPYVITYPTEDIHENSVYRKQHPTSLPLQRSRNVSENSSASSSISHNLPSPGTNWTSNPIHNVDEILPQKQTKQTSQATIDANSIANNAYQPHSFAPTQAQTTSYDGVRTAPQTKSNVTPKPAATNTQYTPLHQSQPTQPKQHVKPPNQKPNTQSQPSIQVKPQQPPLQPRIQPVLQTKVAAPKLKTRSQTLSSTSHQHQSFEQDHQSPVLPRQRTFDSPTIPLQTQNRVLSQQSLVSSKQRQFEQHQQSDPQLLSESRRKSLGNVYDVQQQQRKSAYMSETKTVVKQEYKSSAPLDTPDIVKSSLPKEDIPILKKFGPPQRHHYMPNSYQSPTTNTKAQKFESSSNSTTKVIKNTQQQIVQHSTLTKKPSIVEIPATPQPDEDLIPRNIVFNNISAFTSMSRRHEESDRTRAEPQSRPNRLSKSDSWNQIVQLQNQANAQLPPTSPKFGISSGGSGSELRRTKSGHTLNVRMYEAGIDKAQVGEKKRTVEAYFTGKKSPNQIGGEETVEMRSAVATATTTTTAGAKKSTINRHKTSEKISASRKSLTTMTSNGVPTATATVLGEQRAATSTTEKTETKEKDGAVVTTTTKVTTRTVTGSGGAAAKPVSPFAKFRQLDKQNSQQSPKSPSTPTTPGGTTASPSGSARIFQFTDPALNARAATVKEQLLQWCQSKTQEYENVQISNFSASWSDGLAFCALIHHFLPDAFDYSTLTPKNRRQNFELAFTVADEKAGIAPLLDVEDMVEMKRPDWKCVFIYVQSIYRRFRNCQ